MSKQKTEYETACATHRAAFEVFDAICKSYRARLIDDETFLVAKATYEVAKAKVEMAFDVAAQAGRIS